MKENIKKILMKGILAGFCSLMLTLTMGSSAYAFWSGNSEDIPVLITGGETKTIRETYTPSVMPLPSGFSGKFGIYESGGRALYTCGNCGNTGEILDFKLYGYTDREGLTTYTGWEGYMYCPGCHPYSGHTDSSAYKCYPSAKSVKGPVTKTFIVLNNDTVGYGGVYTLKNMHHANLDSVDTSYLYQDTDGDVHRMYKEWNPFFTWTTDPGVYYNPGNDKNVWNANKPSPVNPPIWWEGNTYGLSKAIRLSSYETYDKSIAKGFHLAYGDRQYINVAYWQPTINTNCIHTLPSSVYEHYRRPGDTENRYKWSNLESPACGQPHQRGYLAVCADCGEVIPVFIYMSPETAATINKIPNHMGYLYTCPNTHAHTWSDYFITRPDLYATNHRGEQWSIIDHSCVNIPCRNQYNIKFNSNINSDVAAIHEIPRDKGTYTLDHFFFKRFTDNGNVYYSDGISHNWSYYTTKNSFGEPGINLDELVFEGWYTAASGGEQVHNWKELYDYINRTSPNSLNTDKNTFTVYAHWTPRKGTLKTVDTNWSAITPFRSGTTVYYNQTIEVAPFPSKKGGEIKCIYNNDGATAKGPSPIEGVTDFDGWQTTSGFGGIYNPQTNIYTGKGTNDVLMAKWKPKQVELPDPHDISEGYFFLGWNKSQTSKDGLLPPGRLVDADGSTYYAHYISVNMTIYARKNPGGNYDGETSTVWWDVNGLGDVEKPFFKIYQHGQIDLGDKDISVTSSQDDYYLEGTNRSKTLALNSPYAVPYTGFYDFTLSGAKGGGSGSYQGGLGAQINVTVFLKEGDVVELKSTAGESGRGSGAQSGGASADLYVNGTKVAVAAGGGGALTDGNYAPTGGGNATSTIQSSDTFTSATSAADQILNKAKETFLNGGEYISPVYRQRYYAYSGGGAGYATSGTTLYGKGWAYKYTHSCNCSYTADCGRSITWVDGGNAQHYDVGEGYQRLVVAKCSDPSHNTGNSTWGNVKCVGTGYYFDGATNDGAGYTGNAYWVVDVGSATGTYNLPADSFQAFLDWLNSNAGFKKCKYQVSYTRNHSAYDNKWNATTGDVGSFASKGADSWVKSGTVISYSYVGTSSSVGGTISINKVGFTTQKQKDNVPTPDRKNPAAPTFVNEDAIKKVEYVSNSDGTMSMYLNYIHATSKDKGSYYYWNGDTYGQIGGKSFTTTPIADTYRPSPSSANTHYNYHLNVDTSAYPEVNSTYRNADAKEAALIITSDIKEYRYLFAKADTVTETVVSLSYTDTWTKVPAGESLKLENLAKFMDKKPVLATLQTGNFYLYVVAVDKANNISPVSKIVIPWVIYPPDTHMPGTLQEPTVNVPEITEGVYQKTSNTYYVKADGETQIGIRFHAELIPTNRSRITDVSGGGYGMSIDPLTRAYTYDGAIGTLTPVNDIPVITSSETYINSAPEKKSEWTIVQKFTTSSEDTNTVTAHAESECTGQNKDGKCEFKISHDKKRDGKTIYIIGDKTAPGISVNGNNANDGYDFGYVNSPTQDVAISITDNGSGVKSYEITDQFGNVITSGEKTSYTTIANTTIHFNTKGEHTIYITVTDNVGNERTIMVTINLDDDYPSIIDETPDSPDVNDDADGDGTSDDTHPKYTPLGPGHAKWEYDWVEHDLFLRYRAKDETNNIASFVMYNSGPTWAKGTVAEVGEIEQAEDPDGGLVIEHTVTREGRSYYILEATDAAGLTSTVYVVVRVDKTAPVIGHDPDDETNLIVPNIRALPPQYLRDHFSDMCSDPSDETFMTTFVAQVWDQNPNSSTISDTSGISHLVLRVYDLDNPTIWKEYPMNRAYSADNPAGYNIGACGYEVLGYTAERNTCPFNPLRTMDGYVSMSRTNNVRTDWVGYVLKTNLFKDFPDSIRLGYTMVAFDNVLNMSDVIVGKQIINLQIKAVIYAAKDDALNIPDSTGTTNVGFFKTGETGYVEVWTLGYADSIMFNFGEVGQISLNEEQSGTSLPRFRLGYYYDGIDDALTRVISSNKATAYGGGFGHYYVGTGSGTTDAGWVNDGTNIRIPESYQLKRPKRDANGEIQRDDDGNILYEWELKMALVYAQKGSSKTDIYDIPPYVIWDESEDDLHYRITYEIPEAQMRN